MPSAPLVNLQGVQDLGAVEITPLRNAMLYIKYQNIMKGQRGNIDLAPRLILHGVKDAACEEALPAAVGWSHISTWLPAMARGIDSPTFRDHNASKTRMLVFTYRKSQCEESMDGGY